MNCQNSSYPFSNKKILFDKKSSGILRMMFYTKVTIPLGSSIERCAGSIPVRCTSGKCRIQVAYRKGMRLVFKCTRLRYIFFVPHRQYKCFYRIFKFCRSTFLFISILNIVIVFYKKIIYNVIRS